MHAQTYFQKVVKVDQAIDLAAVGDLGLRKAYVVCQVREKYALARHI